jgi:8-oxo-dGTP diphosphatase
MMQTRPYFLAVGALIPNDNGDYLLLRRLKSKKHFAGEWETPGGKPNEGESISETLVREAREETRLEIALDGLAGASEFPFPNKENPKIQIVMLYMNAHIVSGKVDLGGSKEHEDHDWLPLSEFCTKKLTPALASFVEKLKSK